MTTRGIQLLFLILCAWPNLASADCAKSFADAATQFVYSDELASMHEPAEQMIARGFFFVRTGQAYPRIVGPHVPTLPVFQDLPFVGAELKTQKAVEGIWALWTQPALLMSILVDLREAVRRKMISKNIPADRALESIRRSYEKRGGFSKPKTIRPRKRARGIEDEDGASFLSDSEWHELLRAGRPIVDNGTNHSLMGSDTPNEGVHVHRNQWLVIALAVERYPELFEGVRLEDLGGVYRDLGGHWVDSWTESTSRGDTPWFFLFDFVHLEDESHQSAYVRVGGVLREASNFNMPDYFDFIFNRVFEEGGITLP